MKLCTLCIKSELLGHRQTCKVSETGFNCWSTNIPVPILHVKLKFEIGHSTCGTLLNERRQALLAEQQQQSFYCILSIFPPYCYASERC